MHIVFDPNSPAAQKTTFDNFLNIDIRLGKVLSAESFPEGRNPTYKLKVDFGPAVGIKKSLAQITHHYSIDDLIGKSVMAVVNFEPRQIGSSMSEVLILGFQDQDKHVLLPSIEPDLPKGSRLL